jgi:hypothetical protein
MVRGEFTVLGSFLRKIKVLRIRSGLMYHELEPGATWDYRCVIVVRLRFMKIPKSVFKVRREY